MVKTRIIWKFRLLRKSGKLCHLWQEVHVVYALECVITSVKTYASMWLSDSLVIFHRVPLHCPQPALNFVLKLPTTYFQILVLAGTFRKVFGRLSILIKIDYIFVLFRPVLWFSFLSGKFICELKVYLAGIFRRLKSEVN
jgi:hypothetical protein